MDDHQATTDAEWQRVYQEALAEADHTKLHDRIVAAEAAIFNRVQILASNPHCQDERQSLFDALARLRGLMTDVLGFPDWNRR